MKSVLLNVSPRVLSRRAGAKALRAGGLIPAVVYGRQVQPQNIEVNAKEMEDLIHHSASENILVDLAIKDDARPKRLALVQEVQHYALTGSVLHVDFHEVAADEKVTVLVPVEAVGEAEGVKTEGGVLEHVMFKIKMRALPKDLPELLTVDVSLLKIGQSIHLGDIKAPENTEIIGDKHATVISVAAPRTEEEEAAELAEGAEAVPGEVEMTKEKKEEGEEGAVPAAKGAVKGAEKGSAKGAEKAPAKGADKAAPGAEKAAPGADKKAAPGAEKKAAPAGHKKK